MLIQFSQIDAPTHIHTNFRFYNISVTMRYIYEVPFNEPYLVTNKEYIIYVWTAMHVASSASGRYAVA